MDSPKSNPSQLFELQIDRSSYVDPNGFVFQFEDGYYRAIYNEFAPFYISMFQNGVVDELIAKYHLVPTEISDLQLPAKDVGLVLKHEAIRPLNYCVEWSPSMLRDAGLALLDLALAVLERDWILQDCYPWNVVFRGTDPIIVDFTSIIRADSPLLWPAYEQYQSFFLRPLELCSQRKGKIARSLLANNILGITIEDFHLSSATRFSPGAWIENKFNEILKKRPAWQVKLRQKVLQHQKQPDRSVRRRFLLGLRKKLSTFNFENQKDIWSSYYAEIPESVDRNKKIESVRSLIREKKPASVTDAGCNTGVFSIIAAEEGATVLSIDSSEACIDVLYKRAVEQHLPVTPLIADLYCPTPAGGFMAKQYPGLLDRIGSDLVLCLGLMHHLHITGRQSIGRIAEFVSAISRKDLIFEYVAAEDDNNVLLSAGRPIRYNESDVLDALRLHFATVHSIPSDRPTRKLLVCSK